MSKKPTNDEVEAHILSCLPASFGEILKKSPDPAQHGYWYRAVDTGLQRLRRRGVIGFCRIGSLTVWNFKETDA